MNDTPQKGINKKPGWIRCEDADGDMSDLFLVDKVILSIVEVPGDKRGPAIVPVRIMLTPGAAQAAWDMGFKTVDGAVTASANLKVVRERFGMPSP